jgi:hypothetical protein
MLDGTHCLYKHQSVYGSLSRAKKKADHERDAFRTQEFHETDWVHVTQQIVCYLVVLSVNSTDRPSIESSSYCPHTIHFLV